jgi:hypothetical protein
LISNTPPESLQVFNLWKFPKPEPRHSPARTSVPLLYQGHRCARNLWAAGVFYVYEKRWAMTIICATAEAAVQVLAVLTGANLRLGRDFHIAPLDGGAPIRITVLVALAADVLHQLRAIPDTTIA